ncbi:MAG: hypothetical protein ACREOU_02570 [Candidatus Eiseniibacteriota bacterium]
MFGSFSALVLFATGCGRYEPGTLPALTEATQDAAWDGDVAIAPNGKSLCFVSERGDGTRALFVRALPTGEPRAIAVGPGNVSRPTWTSDGKRILFTRTTPDGSDERAFVVDAAGGDPRPLDVLIRDAVYAPDGDRVAGVAKSDSSWELVEIRVADFARTTLVKALPPFPLARPAYSPDGKGIAYVWQGDLWWVPAKGGVPIQLTAGAARESDPAFSPDGKWLAFASDSTGYSNLWIARIDKSRGTSYRADDKPFPAPVLAPWRPVTAAFQQARRPAWDPKGKTLWFDRQSPWVVVARDLDGARTDTLSSSLFDDREPSWSGDGFHVLFVSTRSGNDDLWIMDAKGEAATGPAKQVTRFPAEDRMPNWSRASGQIIYVTDREQGGTNLALTDATGADLETVTHGAGAKGEPRWSPDGRALAFSADLGTGFDLYLMEGVARRLRAVTIGAPGGAHAPAFTPDGGALVYASLREGRPSLWRASLDGGPGAPVALTSDDVPGSWDAQPAVSPDGSHVLFTRVRRGDADLWLLDLATGEARPLVENPLSSDQHGDWSPDGRRIAFQAGGAVNLLRADIRPLLLR